VSQFSVQKGIARPRLPDVKKLRRQLNPSKSEPRTHRSAWRRTDGLREMCLGLCATGWMYQTAWLRGCALQVSSMVFVAQFVVSAFMGAVTDLVGSPVVVMVAASILSLCGAVAASKVTYLGLWLHENITQAYRRGNMWITILLDGHQKLWSIVTKRTFKQWAFKPDEIHGNESDDEMRCHLLSLMCRSNKQDIWANAHGTRDSISLIS